MTDVGDNIFFINNDYTIQKVSRRLAQKIGIDDGGLLVGKICHKYFYNLDKPCNSCPVSRSIAFQTVVEGEIQPDAENESAGVRHAIATPVMDEHNQVRQVIVDCLGDTISLHRANNETAAIDKPDRKRVPQLPIEGGDRESPDTLCSVLVDRDLNIILYNQWHDGPGFGNGDNLVGHNLFSVAPFYNQQPVRSRIEGFVKDDNAEYTTFQTKTDIYSEQWLKHEIYKLIGQGRIEAYLILSQFNESADAANSTAIRADKITMLSQFASRISHDIKNPLSLISTSVEFLKADLAKVNTIDGVFKLVDYIDQVQDQVNRVITILDTVNALKVHSMETVSETDAADLLDRSVTITLLSKPYPQNDVKVNIAGPLPPIHVSEINMERALTELFKSLLKNAGENGRLDINLTYVGDLEDQFIFKIHTNAVQKTASNLDEMIDDFLTSAKKFDIANLGMVIAYATILNHAGVMDVLNLDTGELEILIKLPRVPNINA